MNVDRADRLPVVLLHGIRVSGTMWRPVMEIVGRHRAVAAPDLPGHGTRRGERFTMDAAVATAAETVDRLGGRALVVGLSLGGFVGIATAGRHPEQVAGLVAIGCTVTPTGLLATSYGAVARLAARNPAAADRLSAWGFRRMLPGPIAEAVIAGGLSCEVMPQVVDAIGGSNPPEPLKGYPGPVWLVNAARDPFRRNEREFLAACQDGRLVVWPRLNHVSCLADTRALARAVLDAATIAEAAAAGPAVGPTTGSAAGETAAGETGPPAGS